MRLSIVFPEDGMDLPAVPSVFVIGAAPPRATVTVNGRPARVHDEGGFIATIPIEPGRFPVSCTAALGEERATETITLNVASRAAPARRGELWLDRESVQPSADHLLRPGDGLTVSFCGTPGASAHFSIEQVAEAVPMIETELTPPQRSDSPPPFVFGADLLPFERGSAGWYVGTYTFGPADLVRNGRISVWLRGEDGGHVEADAPGRLTVSPPAIPLLARTAGSETVVRTGPGMGYGAILPAGAVVEMTGRAGTEWRISLGGSRSGWVDERSLVPLPIGTPLAPNELRVIRSAPAPGGSRVEIPLARPYAALVTERSGRKRVRLTLTRAVAHLDSIRYGPGERLIEEVTWRQIDGETVEIAFRLRRPLWGYRIAYEGPGLLVDLRGAPEIDGARPLLGRCLAIDPGHSPEPGAVGPLGTLEKDVNLATARCLERMCRERGARTVMTRTGDEAVALARRPEIAREAGAEMLISVHHNSVPPGVDPEKENGFSTYYWNPHSLPLARALHESFAGVLGLPDFGLYRANLAMCRPREMLAVLVEPAFMIIPEQEALLRRGEFQERCARAICEGIEAFLASEATP